MKAHALNPILNVSNIAESFAWFERLGWEKSWDWGTPRLSEAYVRDGFVKGYGLGLPGTGCSGLTCG
jgi:hypothetical protein